MPVEDQRRLSAQEHAFLADAGALLAESLDYERTLARVGELAVRGIADLCIIDLIADDRSIMRLCVTCSDASAQAACDTLRTIQVDSDRPHLLQRVIREQQPVLLSEPSDAQIAAMAQGEQHLAALRAVGIRSMVGVPLIARGQLLGGMALVSTSRARLYGAADVRLAEELARRAALSIANARLYRAAQEASRARDDVLGVVAHDLRNPLQGISMWARLLADTKGHQERRSRQALEAIERAVERMNWLVENLLDVASMDAGKLSLARRRQPAAEIVVAAVEAQARLAEVASLTLRLERADDLPEIDIDSARLLQVFENLIGNAIKFTPPGGVVTVGARRSNGDVLFSVRDTGPGIREQEMPRLFERFWQAGDIDRRGVGLGLPIAKYITEAHGGRMWVDSTVGEGSTFFFTVPALA